MAIHIPVLLDHCIVTWGSFCPVESIGMTVALVVGVSAFGALIALPDHFKRKKALREFDEHTAGWEQWEKEAFMHILRGEWGSARIVLAFGGGSERGNMLKQLLEEREPKEPETKSDGT